MDSALNYSYFKLRKDFGRQPMFSETPAVLLDSVNPCYTEQKLYCLRNPVNHEAQTSITLSEQFVNTKRIVPQDQGINHAEGGWPKDIHFNDDEATARYRRRFERDDSYVDAVLSLNPMFQHLINQNNAIEMYNMYFKEMKPENPVEKYSIKVVNTFKDLEERPIASIGWTYENDSKLVVAYCNKKYPICGSVNKCLEGYVWDLRNSIEPSDQFIPPTSCWQVICSPTHPKIIMGGLEDGRVCIFDIREKKEPVKLCAMHLAHRDPVSALLFLYSRLNTEFFSGSSDGKCMWWDVRNISSPIDSLIMSVRMTSRESVSLATAEGISALQFDKAFPTKFLCGTETGYVINVNRKGKTHQEVMSAIYYTQFGPVKAVHRSPCTSKVFITCGDWTVNIWSDDIHSSPIMSGRAHRMQISDVVWSPQRISSYMSICHGGKLRYWDLLRRHRDAIAVIPISKYPLLKIKPNKEGQVVAIGDTKGSLYIISLSENLVLSDSKDKNLMTQTFEREGRREHILETRVKEIKLKLKSEDEGTADSSNDLVEDENILIKNAEDEYRRIIAEETRQYGATQTTNRGFNMRNR